MVKNTNELTELVSKIKEANAKYRVGIPIMSDTEYDNLLDSLNTVMPSEDYRKFRVTLTEEAGKVRHPYSMGSLDKIKAYDPKASISKWILKTVPNTDSETDGLFISSKIDGCSARLSYVDGKLIGASTRGNGDFGTDVFRKALLFVPNTLNSKFTGEIRGEMTLTKDTFAELVEFNQNKSYKNLRNGTAGLINGKDISDEEVSFLRFFAYEIMGITGLSKPEQFDKLKKLGFETALYQRLTDIYNSAISYDDTSIDDVLLKIYNEFSEKAPFDIDGLVVSDINDHEVFENTFLPSRTVAVKFNQMTADTTLINVIWNVSKSGRLSPIGVIDSVELGGSCVSNVTLNNLRMMKEQKLAYGCTVTVLKSGDVIPKIIAVKHEHSENEVPIDYPTVCPSCGHKLVYEDNGLFPICTNKECPDVVHAKILHFLRQLGIKHVSTKTIAKFSLRSIKDLVDLVPDDGAVKRTFYNDLNKMMFGAPKEKLISAFDYDGVSSQIIDKMISHYGYGKLISSTFEELSKDKPYGVGDKFLEIFCNGFKNIKEEFDYILSSKRYYGNSVKNALKSDSISTGPLKGKAFVVTGALSSMSRDNFRDTVIANGGTYQSSVSKKTNYLVCNDVSSATTKVQKAKSLGVMVIDEDKFLHMLKDGEDGFAIF